MPVCVDVPAGQVGEAQGQGGACRDVYSEPPRGVAGLACRHHPSGATRGEAELGGPRDTVKLDRPTDRHSDRGHQSGAFGDTFVRGKHVRRPIKTCHRRRCDRWGKNVVPEPGVGRCRRFRPCREVGGGRHRVVDGQFSDLVPDVDLGVNARPGPHGHVLAVRPVEGEQFVANEALQFGDRLGDRERARRVGVQPGPRPHQIGRLGGQQDHEGCPHRLAVTARAQRGPFAVPAHCDLGVPQRHCGHGAPERQAGTDEARGDSCEGERRPYEGVASDRQFCRRDATAAGVEQKVRKD